METKNIGQIKQINFKINISILLILIVIGGFLIALFILMPQYKNELTFIAAILGGMGTIYSAFFIGQNLKIGITQNAIHRSFELISRIENFDFMKNITLVEKELKNKDVSASDLYEKITANEELHSAVKSLLVAYQIVATAIIKEYANEETLFIHFRRVIISNYKNYQSYIERMRKELDSPLLYIEFETLYQSWYSGKYLFSGKKILKSD